MVSYAIGKDVAMQMARKATAVIEEKTTVLITATLGRAVGAVASSQAAIIMSLSTQLPSDAPLTADWHSRWQSWGINLWKSLGTHSPVSFSFEDGSLVGVLTRNNRLLCVSKLGNNRPDPQFWDFVPVEPFNLTKYNLTTFAFIESSSLDLPYEPRLEPNYNSSLGPFALKYSDVIIGQLDGLRSIRLAFSLFNTSRIFLGMGEVQLNLDMFDMLVGAQLFTENSHIFVLGRERNIIASSLTHSPIVTNETVSMDYMLTELDVVDGCTLIKSPIDTSNVQFKICLKTSRNFPYPPLRAMYERGMVPARGSAYPHSREVSCITLGDLGQFFISIVDYNVYFPTLDWIALVIVPEEEILKEIRSSRSISVGVSCALALCVAVAQGLLLHLFLRPLTSLAKGMRSASYLEEDSPTEEAHIDKNETQTSQSAIKVEKKKRRPLSYLTDVAAIQSAYFEMTDELRVLRGYIPEHIRDHLLETRRRAASVPTEAQPSSSGIFQGDVIATAQQNPSDKHSINIDENVALAKQGEDIPHIQALSTGLASHHIEDERNSHGEYPKGEFPNGGEMDGQDTAHIALDGVLSPSLDTASYGHLTSNSFTDIARECCSKVPPINPFPLFSKNGLVERNVAVALINICGFHSYIFRTSTANVINEHATFVSFLYEVAKRHGGNLESFSGDKFYVSFNASSHCEGHQVACVMFAHDIASTISSEAEKYRERTQRKGKVVKGIPPLSPLRPRFPVALQNVTIGVGAGRALVGTLGTDKIRRYTISGKAISDASALERMATKYPDCQVMIGGDLIPEVEGYVKFLLLDATSLPSSGGHRRRIASIKGLLFPGPPSKTLSPIETFTTPLSAEVRSSLSLSNPFANINDCFNAYLEGRILVVIQKLAEIRTHVDLCRQLHGCQFPPHRLLPDGRPFLEPADCDHIALMLDFISSISETVDGRQYRSPFGDSFVRNEVGCAS